jgi:hypothetical protein
MSFEPMRVRAAAAKAQPVLKLSLLAMLVAAGVAQAAEQTLLVETSASEGKSERSQLQRTGNARRHKNGADGARHPSVGIAHQ